MAEVGGLDDWRHALSVDCAADSGALAIALATADNGDTLSIQGTCKGTFEIAHDLTLQGSASSTLDGQAADTVLTIDAGKTVFVADLTVTGGLATSFIPGGENGGGIWNNGTLTLRDSTIRGNATSFSGNGAGIYSRGTLTVSDSTVTGNSNSFSGGGAGIFNFAGTLRLNNSTVSGNTTSFGQGGGIYKLLWHVDTQQQHGQRQHRWSRRWRRKPWGRDGRE